MTAKPDAWREDWISTVVTGIRRTPPTGAPTLLLTDTEGVREFCAPLGPDVAHLLAHEFHNDPTPYSLTCGLVEKILNWVDGRATAVKLERDGNGPPVAEVELEVRGERRLMHAGLGEAVVLAWRHGLPILVPAALVNVVSDVEDGNPTVLHFRKFLDRVKPDEFAH
jgi:bifunctional DNase/RNase